MPINPHSEASFTFVDYSDEDSVHTLNTLLTTAGNFAAQITAMAAYQVALLAVTLGNLKNQQYKASILKFNAVPPTDANAQRERKWLVKYQDAVTFAPYKVEVPTAMLESGGTSWLQPGTDLIDLTVTEVAAFVSQFEGFARSPEGNAVEILEIVAVGRNL